jgi:outer membrane lipoprotein-sorting protein
LKKWLSFCLVAILFLSCLALAGCGGKKETGPAPGEKPAASKTGGDESAASLFAKARDIKGMSYDYVMTMPNETVSGKVWMQGKNVKTEGTADGQKIVSIINGDTNTCYAYYPDQNTAMRMTSEGEAQETKAPTDYTEDVDPLALKFVETAVFDGAKCKVYTWQSAEGTMKYWVRADYGIPVRVETTLADGTQMVMEYKNLKVGPVPAKTFELPAGVQVTDMNEMMNQMPQIPTGP